MSEGLRFRWVVIGNISSGSCDPNQFPGAAGDTQIPETASITVRGCSERVGHSRGKVTADWGPPGICDHHSDGRSYPDAHTPQSPHVYPYADTDCDSDADADTHAHADDESFGVNQRIRLIHLRGRDYDGDGD